MKVTEFLKKNLVIADMQSTEKSDAIKELATHLAQEEKLPPNDVLKVLLERERLGSTGIGEGVAIPHGTMGSLDHLVATFGRSAAGIEFDAVDGRRTHLFFVLLTPDNNVGLQALARVSRMMRDPALRDLMMEASDADDLFAVIRREDERL